MALIQFGLVSVVSFVGFYISGLLQNRGVASTSYVLCVRVTSTEHFAETLKWKMCNAHKSEQKGLNMKTGTVCAVVGSLFAFVLDDQSSFNFTMLNRSCFAETIHQHCTPAQTHLICLPHKTIHIVAVDGVLFHSESAAVMASRVMGTIASVKSLPISCAI